MQTDFQTMVGDLNAGVFAQQVGRALSDVAAGVVDTGKKGKVTLTFDLKRIGEAAQVNISHKVAFKRPTTRGEATEVTTSDTPMYVGARGVLSLMPGKQLSLDMVGAADKAGA